MKRVSVVFLALLFVISLTGCSKVKLEEGQIYTTFKSSGDLIISAYMSDNDAEDNFSVDTTDKKSSIKSDLEDAFDDFYDMDVKVTKIKANKDYLKFTITSDEADNMGFDLDYTLEDYADDNYYDDIDALADTEDFVYFKSGDDVKSKDLADYEEDIVVTVNGGDEGCYYKFPGKIVALSDIDFEKISKDTIYIDKDEYGIVIFNK